VNINEFYAVTLTSVYHVRALGNYRASAVKIALKGNSQVQVGHDIAEGGMIAICRDLQGYVPEKYGFSHPMTGFERRLELVNGQWWRGGTSPIVALFKTEEEATACLNSKNLRPRDPRWIDSTRRVMEEIGDAHPSFYVCHYRGMELLEAAAAA
jgi:hypothetical protein